MNKHYVYIRETDDMNEQKLIDTQLDRDTRRSFQGLGWAFAGLVVYIGMWCSAHAQTIAAPTRTTAFDWACLDASGAVLSTHQRFDTAFVACYNNPAGVSVQGGTYKLASRTTTPPPVTCPPAPASSTRMQTCPTGTTGSWQQTSTSSVGSPPACTVTTTWAPVDAPAGACVAVVVPPPTPSAPAGLAASIAPNQTTPANSNVTLTWTAVSGVDKYEVWRCAGATCTNFAFTAPDATATTWVNANLPPGLTYRYKVRAWQPVTGPFSDIVNVTTPPQPPPQVGTGTATVEWTHDGANVEGFRIVYGTAADALTNTYTVLNAGVRTAVIDKLASGTWFFAVRAYLGGIESANSNVASKAIP